MEGRRGSASTKSKTPSALIVDFDDTLVRTRKSRTALVVKTLAEMGVRAEPDALAAHWGIPFRDLVVKCAPALTDERTYDLFATMYTRAAQAAPLPLRPGARMLLTSAAVLGVEIHIVTSSPRQLVMDGLVARSLERYITTLWAEDDTPYHKPDPRVLAGVIKQLDGAVEDAVVIGDDVLDWAAARPHGVGFIGVCGGVATRSDFRRAGVDAEAVFSSLRQAVALAPSLAALRHH